MEAGLGRLDDAELVSSALAGDKCLFVVLVGRHRATALALAWRLLFDAESAADAVQEATVAAMVSLARLRSPERFGAWFCGITMNVARRWLREVRPLVELRDVDTHAGGPEPDEVVQAAEMNRLVRQAVKALAPGQRDAVLLFYWQGLSHADAAAEIGVSVGAVKSRLHQARRALQPVLVTVAEPVEVSPMSDQNTSRPVDVVVAEIRRGYDDDPAHRGHVVVLAERDGDRRLPIWIGRTEAAALAVSLEAVEMARPMTYQLAANLLTAAGARLSEVRVTRLDGNTFLRGGSRGNPSGSDRGRRPPE